jgi:adenosyl cobinamide kinase/adenosyl cobinamide phosphate guanylyltransferase
MGRLIYLTGPVRSGKSRHAVELVRGWGSAPVFVATYRPDPSDLEMAERVRRHQAERPGWRTLEAPADVAGALSALDPVPGCALMDCLTLWASDRFHLGDDELLAAWDAQLGRFRAFPWPMVIVGNEVGWSPVPGDPGLRRFRDLAGWLGQRTAQAADEAWLLVAGCPVRLK